MSVAAGCVRKSGANEPSGLSPPWPEMKASFVPDGTMAICEYEFGEGS